MALQPFSWGPGGQKASPSSVKKHAEIAAALAARGGAPSNLGEGLNRVGEALLANSYSSRAAAGEEEGAASRKAVMDALMGNADPSMADISGALGNEWVTSDPGSSAIVQALLGQELQQNDPLRQQQLEKGQFELDALRNPTPAEPDYPTSYDEFLLGQDNPDYAATLGKGGQTINVGGNNDIGTIPAGMMVTRDEAGNVTGMKPIPGSPAEREALAAVEAAEAGTNQTSRYGNVVVEDIDRALGVLANDPTWSTGILGQAMGNFKGSSSDRLNNLLDTVRANSAFDRLQAMRDASPTGGALGAVSERELGLLQSAIGSLETGNAEDLAYNLKRLQTIYSEIIDGPAASQAPNQSTVAPADIDALLEKYGTP